ncbi:hypothetical protein [Accumulibacter sp.]|uniref:hypothetical protein n=1 Tax=Accumulibacter sp. TaxID=2053492 RepID=UPI0035B0BEC1
MSIGSSGRIVVEVEPALKRALYAALAREGSTLKKWFLQSAEQYLSTTNGHIALPLDKTEEPEFVTAPAEPYQE